MSLPVLPASRGWTLPRIDLGAQSSLSHCARGPLSRALASPQSSLPTSGVASGMTTWRARGTGDPRLAEGQGLVLGHVSTPCPPSPPVPCSVCHLTASVPCATWALGRFCWQWHFQRSCPGTHSSGWILIHPWPGWHPPALPLAPSQRAERGGLCRAPDPPAQRGGRPSRAVPVGAPG